MAKKRARKKRIVPKELDKPVSVPEKPYVPDTTYVYDTETAYAQPENAPVPPKEAKKHWWQF